jgi:hypothetical protein
MIYYDLFILEGVIGTMLMLGLDSCAPISGDSERVPDHPNRTVVVLSSLSHCCFSQGSFVPGTFPIVVKRVKLSTLYFY